MHFFQSFLLCFLFFFSCGETRNNDNNQDIDMTVRNWNKATVSSLKSHIGNSGAPQTKIYENRLLAFKAYVDMENDKINSRSIRYQLLKEFLKAKGNKSDFYIIEANSSGESIELRNYIVRQNANKASYVDVYNYINDKWIKNTISEQLNLHFDSGLKKYATKFGLGINQDDVIITQFSNNAVKTSEYYLYGTLSAESGIKRLLLLK